VQPAARRPATVPARFQRVPNAPRPHAAVCSPRQPLARSTVSPRPRQFLATGHRPPATVVTIPPSEQEPRKRAMLPSHNWTQRLRIPIPRNDQAAAHAAAVYTGLCPVTKSPSQPTNWANCPATATTFAQSTGANAPKGSQNDKIAFLSQDSTKTSCHENPKEKIYFRLFWANQAIRYPFDTLPIPESAPDADKTDRRPGQLWTIPRPIATKLSW